MTIHCNISENFNFQQIYTSNNDFLCPPHAHTTINATVRFAEEYYMFFVIGSGLIRLFLS